MNAGETLPGRNRGPQALAWLVPLLLSLAVYVQAPWNELVWDDPLIFEQQMSAIESPRDVFIVPEGVPQWSPDYYRPVVTLSYLADLSWYRDADLSWLGLSDLQESGVFIAGKDSRRQIATAMQEKINRSQVAGLHLSNMIFHALTSLFAGLLALRMFAHFPHGWLGALLAASAFAVHPIHTESVHWIAGRSDVLATMFLLPAASLALRWRDRGAWWALFVAAVLFLLALMSKEVAIAGLVLIPALMLLTPEDKWSAATAPGEGGAMVTRRARLQSLIALATLGVMTIGYFLARQTDGVAYGVSLDVSWANYLTRLEKSLGYYLVKVVWPWPQSSFTGWEAAPASWLTSVVLLAVTALAFLGWVLLRRYRDGTVLMALTWFIVAVLPSVAVAMRAISSTPFAERYLYLPSFGLVLLLGFACCQTYDRRWAKPMIVLVAAVIVGWSVGTFERGKVWANNLVLWTDTTQKSPNLGDAWNQLGVALLADDRQDEALQAFLRAVNVPNSPYGRALANHNIAIIYQLRDEFDNAAVYYREALSAGAPNPEMHYGLGILYRTMAIGIETDPAASGEYRELLAAASEQFERAITLNPFFALARQGQVTVLTRQGKLSESEGRRRQALDHYRAALKQYDQLARLNPSLVRQADAREVRHDIEAALERLGKTD